MSSKLIIRVDRIIHIFDRFFPIPHPSMFDSSVHLDPSSPILPSLPDSPCPQLKVLLTYLHYPLPPPNDKLLNELPFMTIDEITIQIEGWLMGCQVRGIEKYKDCVKCQLIEWKRDSQQNRNNTKHNSNSLIGHHPNQAHQFSNSYRQTINQLQKQSGNNIPNKTNKQLPTLTIIIGQNGFLYIGDWSQLNCRHGYGYLIQVNELDTNGINIINNKTQNKGSDSISVNNQTKRNNLKQSPQQLIEQSKNNQFWSVEIYLGEWSHNYRQGRGILVVWDKLNEQQRDILLEGIKLNKPFYQNYIKGSPQSPLFPSNIYHGSFIRNFPHGQLGQYYSDGWSYVGGWRQGMKEGKGIEKYVGVGEDIFGRGQYEDLDNRNAKEQKGHNRILTAYYQGNYTKGLRHGAGYQLLNNGDSYLGQFNCGLRHGFGRYEWTTGEKYQGQFANGLRNGYGEWVGISNWVQTNQGKKEEQDRSNNGRSKLNQYREDEYEVFDRSINYGATTNLNPSQWPRQFQPPQLQPRQLQPPSYSGYYRLNRKHGQGIYRDPYGTTYDGQFNGGQKHGIGIITYTNGKVGKFRWHKGKIIEKMYCQQEERYREKQRGR